MDRQPASRLQRLQEIAQDLGAVLEDDATPLSPLSSGQVPTFRVPDDERKADAILAELRIEASQNSSHSKGLKRAFSKAKSPTTYKYEELYLALTRVVKENGLAGVTEVLLDRFKQAEGDINLARRASTGVIKKIRNVDHQEERGRLLQMATESRRPDLVQLLAPFADQESLDDSLRVALEIKQLVIMEILLDYGK